MEQLKCIYLQHSQVIIMMIMLMEMVTTFGWRRRQFNEHQFTNIFMYICSLLFALRHFSCFNRHVMKDGLILMKIKQSTETTLFSSFSFSLNSHSTHDKYRFLLQMLSISFIKFVLLFILLCLKTLRNYHSSERWVL